MCKVKLFAKKCDISGIGMNEGFCIGGGEMYIRSEDDLKKHIKEKTDYKSKEEAFEDEYYYWTDWFDDLKDPEEGTEAFDYNGVEYVFYDETWECMHYPFKMGEVYFTICLGRTCSFEWSEESCVLYSNSESKEFFKSSEEAFEFINLSYGKSKLYSGLLNQTLRGLRLLNKEVGDDTCEIIARVILGTIKSKFVEYLFTKYVAEKYEIIL